MRFHIMRRAAGTEESSPSTLEADWLLRSGQDGANPQPGVVWFHDFRSDAEVNAFRFTNATGGGNDPNASGHAKAGDVRRITTDGMASGACLECLHPAGSGISSVWWRPFSPLTAPGNGKAANDPGAGGTITPRSYTATQGGSQLLSHTTGWYGHQIYKDAQPANFDGTEFYCQLVVKMDPRRITGGNAANTVGKFLWFTQCESSNSFVPNEHVFYSYGNGGNQGTQNYLRCYVARAGGTNPLNDLVPGGRIQAGSDVAADWYWSGGWDVVLIHIRCGQVGVSSGPNSTKLEVWAARQGETSYTKIWNQEFSFTNTAPDGSGLLRNGIQSFIGSVYNNNFTFPQTFFHRYAQVVFSHNTIPCPQVWPTTKPLYFTSATTGRWLELPARMSDLSPAPDSGIMAYSSAFIATPRKLVNAASGGHGDSAQNQALVMDLFAESPAWVREVASSTSTQNDVAYYADGKPTSRHTYDQAVYIPAHVTNGDRWFSAGASNVAGTGNAHFKFGYGYKLGSGAYDPQGFWPTEYPGGLFPGSNWAYDSATDLIWVKEEWIFVGGALRNFNPANKTYSARFGSIFGMVPSHAAMNSCIDPVRRIFLFIEGGKLHAYDLADPTHAPYINMSKTGAALPTASAPGLEYDPHSLCFFAWSGGQTLYKIVPDAANWRTGAWTISTVSIVGGGATPPAARVEGTYRGFSYVADLNAFAVCTGTTQPTYLFKKPDGVLS